MKLLQLAGENLERQLRTVLIVSPYFPPSSLAGVHRARHLAKHLPAHGWRPIVVRVDERYYTELPDLDLAAMLPSRIEQVRVGAFPQGIARIAGVGDVGLRAYWHLQSALARAALMSAASVVLIIGSPFYPMLLARWIRNKLKLPVVLDFQDPWVSGEGATRPMFTKAGIAHRLAVALEPRALRHADFVTSVSTRQNEEMAVRYPWLDSSRMAAIPIGGDPDDFERLRHSPPVHPVVTLDASKINLSYVGTYLPRGALVLTQVFKGLARLRADSPALAEKIRLNFVGTSNQPNGFGAYCVKPLATAHGVGDLVNETPQRVPFIEALSILANSSGILLVGSNEPHYTASKIYPALMSGRPILSVFHSASSAHSILSQAGGGRALSFADVDGLDQLVPDIAAGLEVLAEQPHQLGRVKAGVYDAYSANEIAANFARVFGNLRR